MNNYELVYYYSTQILVSIIPRVERHEKNIYHELRELNGLSRTAIHSNNVTWKDELKKMLSLEGYQLTWDDIAGNNREEILQNIENILVDSGYTEDLIRDAGIQGLISTNVNGKFSNNSNNLNKSLNIREMNGLKKELLVAIKRYAWAKDLDPNSIFIETAGFNKGAYSEGKMDVSIRLPKVNNRRQIRSEIKNYADIFKIGTMGIKYIKPILDSVYFTKDLAKNEIIFHVDGDIVEDCCNNFLQDKYTDWFPFIEDGNKILLFSEFIRNIVSTNRLELRNYGSRVFNKSFPLDIKKLQSLEKIGERGKTSIFNVINFDKVDFQLWYGKQK